MAADKEKTQRRVYVIPTELVERVIQFQVEMGLPSEVEAVRRLLDEALMHRDDWRQITYRFAERLKSTRVLTDIAKDVLMGHPLVKKLSLDPGIIEFSLATGETVRIKADGRVSASNPTGDQIPLGTKERPIPKGLGIVEEELELPF